MAASVPELVVLDADGTLVPEGHGSTPSRQAMAVLDEVRDRTTLALVSGRTVPDTRKVAEAAGIDLFCAELGGVLVTPDGQRRTFPWDRAVDPVEAVHASGVVEAIRARYPTLSVDEYGHRVTVPLSGEATPEEVAEIRALVEGSDADLTVLDNTVSGRIVVLHVGPVGVGKVAGVRALQEHLGVPPEATVMFGDSPEDASCHPCVRTLYLVANGIHGPIEDRHVVRTAGEDGAGVAWGLRREFGLQP